MDVNFIIKKLASESIGAILPVHVYGCPADVIGIDAAVKDSNATVIYDAAHAFGVKFQGKSISNYGDISTLSENWELLWSDEFNDEELDLTKWNKLNWKPGWVNNELQAYTDRDTNIFLENGHLVLQGNIEPGYSGTDYVGNNYVADYTSGRVNTDNKFSTTYGRFDIKAKLPSGKG